MYNHSRRPNVVGHRESSGSDQLREPTPFGRLLSSSETGGSLGVFAGYAGPPDKRVGSVILSSK